MKNEEEKSNVDIARALGVAYTFIKTKNELIENLVSSLDKTCQDYEKAIRNIEKKRNERKKRAQGAEKMRIKIQEAKIAALLEASRNTRLRKHNFSVNVQTGVENDSSVPNTLSCKDDLSIPFWLLNARRELQRQETAFEKDKLKLQKRIDDFLLSRAQTKTRSINRDLEQIHLKEYKKLLLSYIAQITGSDKLKHLEVPKPAIRDTVLLSFSLQKAKKELYLVSRAMAQKSMIHKYNLESSNSSSSYVLEFLHKLQSLAKTKWKLRVLKNRFQPSSTWLHSEKKRLFDNFKIKYQTTVHRELSFKLAKALEISAKAQKEPERTLFLYRTIHSLFRGDWSNPGTFIMS